jgi:DNA-binding response OmpR family regulator
MMVTANGDDERRRWAEEAGAFQFIPKPVDFDLLEGRAAPAAGRLGMKYMFAHSL